MGGHRNINSVYLTRPYREVHKDIRDNVNLLILLFKSKAYLQQSCGKSLYS